MYIGLESDYKKASLLLREIMNELLSPDFKTIESELRKAQKEHFISFSQYTPIVYTKIQERGIQLSLRYLCKPRKRRVIEHQITEEIIDRFRAQKDIRIVYPITSIYLEKEE